MKHTCKCFLVFLVLLQANVARAKETRRVKPIAQMRLEKMNGKEKPKEISDIPENSTKTPALFEEPAQTETPQVNLEGYWKSTPLQALKQEEIDEKRRKSIETMSTPPKEYRYASFGSGDPFVPPINDTKQDLEGKKDLSAPTRILSMLEASSFKVSGVWRAAEGIWKAILISTDGQAVIAQDNDTIGLNQGKIARISEEGVLIREYVENQDGMRQLRTILLPLEATRKDGEVTPVVTTSEILNNESYGH